MRKMHTKRKDEDMKALILGIAEGDARIRAVVLNGSRANPNIERDGLEDWDIVYYVTDIEPFRDDLGWVEVFGDMLIMQMPDLMDGIVRPHSFTWLMQFVDGNRIDLTLRTLSTITEKHDSLSIVLLDKDGILSLPPPSEVDYFPTPPTQLDFAHCVNEFRWVSPYVAKGLVRGEITYARHHLDSILRPQLMKMLIWHFGIKTDFSKNAGKNGKFLRNHLESGIWDRLMATYSEGSWQALFSMYDLFHWLAEDVAAHFAFPLSNDEGEGVRGYLLHLRADSNEH